jgi:hypothetical protein
MSVARWMRWPKQWRRSSQAGEAKKILRSVGSKLEGISSSTEGVFLQAGERLMSLQAHANEISQIATSVAKLQASDSGALTVLDEVLAAACGARNTGHSDQVRELQTQARAIQQAIDTIGPAVKTFDVLSVMIRIESVRCESTGAVFVGLADSVTRLSQQIREHIGATADAATLLLETISGAADDIGRLLQERQASLGPLTSEASAELLRIGDNRQRASQATELLGARFGDISAAVGNIVTALQFHDIVRQQMEHTTEALRLEEADVDAGEVARLRAAQLQHSRTIFENSVQKIREALTQVEQNAGMVAEEVAGLLSISGSGGDSHFSSIELGLENILAILQGNADADRRLKEAAVSIQQPVSEIAKTVEGVRTIGIEMQRIAMNATIQATRLERSGGALEIVALAILTLARQIETSSDTLEQCLRTVREDAAAVGTATAADSEAEGQVALLRQSAAALGSMETRAKADCARTVELTAALQHEIGETISGFGTQDECLRSMDAAIQALQEISAREAPGEDAAAEQGMSQYTMHSERVVHRALYDADNPAGDVPAESPPPVAEENVEFF